MTLVLDLPVEIETELRKEAKARGVAIEDYAIERLRGKPHPEVTRDLEALDALLSLGARLTSNTEPLADDAVTRSYSDHHDEKAAA